MQDVFIRSEQKLQVGKGSDFHVPLTKLNISLINASLVLEDLVIIKKWVVMKRQYKNLTNDPSCAFGNLKYKIKVKNLKRFICKIIDTKIQLSF